MSNHKQPPNLWVKADRGDSGFEIGLRNPRVILIPKMIPTRPRQLTQGVGPRAQTVFQLDESKSDMDIYLTFLGDWFHENKIQLNQKGIEYTFSDVFSDSDKPAQYVDFETPQFLARITIWSSGECDAEAIDINSGKRVVYVHDIFESISEMEKALPSYIMKLTKIEILN